MATSLKKEIEMEEDYKVELLEVQNIFPRAIQMLNAWENIKDGNGSVTSQYLKS